MTPIDIRTGVVTAIRAIAPEVDAQDLDGNVLLRAQVDLDSIDWLHVLIGLHGRFGVDIPESDYARLDTLNHLVDYLAHRLAT